MVLAVPVALGLVVLMTGTAFADNTVTTTGGSIMCNVYQTHRSGGYADCWLKDTLTDKKQVYAILQTDGWPSTRKSNSGGDGTTLSFTHKFGSDVPHWEFKYKVCRKVNLGSDNCSPWRRVHA